MIAAIQLRGHIGARGDVKDTLKMLGLAKKNACVTVEDNPVNKGMLNKCKDFIAYGEVSEETAKKLDAIKKGKTAHLHPPRGGLKSVKRPYTSRGDLGPRPDMDDLVQRMLP